MKKFSCPVSHYTHTIFLLLLYHVWNDRIKFTKHKITHLCYQKKISFMILFILALKQSPFLIKVKPKTKILNYR